MAPAVHGGRGSLPFSFCVSIFVEFFFMPGVNGVRRELGLAQEPLPM